MSIDLKTLEKTIRQQGVLLEHATRDGLVSAIVAGKGSINYSQVSDVFQNRFRLESSSVEVDVYVRALYSRTLGNLCPANTDNWLIEDYVLDAAKLKVHFIAECKGHAKTGFLLTRELKKKEHYLQPAYQIPLHSYATNRDLPQKQTPLPQGWTVSKRPCQVKLVDWGYFYKERSGEVYPQDSSGGLNKFLGGIDQLNYAVGGLLIALEEDRDALYTHHLVPMLVTNCEIIVMELDASNVTLQQTVPWVAYRNPFKPKYYYEYRQVFDTFYVVGKDHLREFHDAYMTEHINGTPLAYPKALEPQALGEFPL